MDRVILDTNFLMIPGSIGVDVFSELERVMDGPYEVCVLRGTVAELSRIMEKDKSKNKIAARIAQQLLKSKNIKILEHVESVDDAIAELSAEPGTYVATQDLELRRRLRCRAIVLRQQKYLMVN